MRIALIQCPAFGIDRPPIALAYLYAVLQKHGYEVDVFDLNMDLYLQADEETKKFWDFKNVFQWLDENRFLREEIIPKTFFEKKIRDILASAPDVLGFSLQSSSLVATLYLAKAIKAMAPEKTIIFGGPLHLSYSLGHVYKLLKMTNDAGVPMVDVIVLGEGEETLIEVLERMKGGTSLGGCLGTVLIEKGKIIRNDLRPFIKDLDALPFPDFTDFSLPHKKIFPILGSRGCIHKCVFCDDRQMWSDYRNRSALNIFAEMNLRKRQGAQSLEFNDLLINGNLPELSKLLDSLIRAKIDIPWGGSASIDRRMDPDFFKRLKEAGCRYLNYGIESASPKVLKDMNKGFLIEDAKRIIEDTYKAGIFPCTNWIVSFPTETESDFNMTLDFIRANIRYLKNNMMVNSFIFKWASSVFQNQDQFGVVSDDEGNWHSREIRSIQERKERYDILLKLISDLNDIPAHETFQ